MVILSVNKKSYFFDTLAEAQYALREMVDPHGEVSAIRDETAKDFILNNIFFGGVRVGAEILPL